MVPALKGALFALLACNTAIFFVTGTASEATDSAAWLALLVLFALESGTARFREGRAAIAIRGARLVAAAAVAAATVGYLREGEWLDAVNNGLWIAMIAVFEIQLRYPRAAAQHPKWFATALILAYAGLGALVLVWALRGEWFDAYDAALWLAALVTIEADVAGSLPPRKLSGADFL